jgi:hypothetical protein
MPDVSSFIAHYIAAGWIFGFIWHFVIGSMFAWTESLEESV